MATAAESLDTNQIRDWRSIVTLIVFVITNIIVLFPFHIPVYLPRWLANGFLDALSALRIISPRRNGFRIGARDGRPNNKRSDDKADSASDDDDNNGKDKSWIRLRFPLNFVTAPLIADLFLLAILAIGREEVRGGTIGADNISPIDIMVFFITLAYIAISIDASGLIRYLAFRVLKWGGKVGYRLFFFLYAFFFILGSFIGNDPIILSGTAFLAYMTRVSSNILHPRAWIHTQFAVANIASAILVSSNPTNLVLAGAFKIRFIDYTANMIVPVIITAVVLFPFLLYIVFASESLIPQSIEMHELPEEVLAKKPVNPNIPNARGTAEQAEDQHVNDEEGKKLSLEEIMNPFLDKGGAAFGALIMAATLITILVLNATSTGGEPHPVYWVTLPAAAVMLAWDLGFGWYHKDETREIARKGREEIELARLERAIRDEQLKETQRKLAAEKRQEDLLTQSDSMPENSELSGKGDLSNLEDEITPVPQPIDEEKNPGREEIERRISEEMAALRNAPSGPKTLTSISRDAYRWMQETFPTPTAVMAHLPFALVPFAFAMFVLVQALGSRGWVAVFAYGWDHWVEKTGTVGAIGGMGFLSVILCNFAGTNIGTTILLSRVIQSWVRIHTESGIPITNRTFWATVYSMAVGVNYGAFSTAFSASLAGLLWRDILARKHIHVGGLEFARVNLPIIAIAMTVGLVALIGEIYITRDESPYVPA